MAALHGSARALDDRQPVLVGVGQITQREADPRAAAGPLDLMAQAARAAAQDAMHDSGLADALLQGLDQLTVIRLFSDTSPRFVCPFGRYANPPLSLARRLGASQVRQHVYTHPGGNMPQYCLNRLGEAITRGDIDSALVVGAEALATQKAAQRANIALDWSEDPGGSFDTWGVARRGWSDVEDRHGARAAITMYPMFDNAIRGALGRSIADHQQAMGELLARFAAVAAANPLADRRSGYSAEQIATAGPGNPVIAWPYTRLMSANAFIDQGAAVIMTSVARAKALGNAPERWVKRSIWSGGRLTRRQVFGWVYRFALPAHFEMQLDAVRIAAAHFGNFLALAHVLVFFHQQALVVGVGR